MNLPTQSIIISLFVSVLTLDLATSDECVPRDFGYSSIVCVCNSTYCDWARRNVPPPGQYQVYESTKDGKRMSQTTGYFNDETCGGNEVRPMRITLNPDDRRQRIHGFGGAFTDSAGINMVKMSPETQDQIIKTYFGENGSRYNLGRVPIAGTDFSTRAYSYADTKDEELKSFSLAMEDFAYKMPYMRSALETNPELRFVSAAWTAPPWMKTNNDYRGFGFLKKKYYQTYAEYLVRFFTEYKRHGLAIWATSTGNEPLNVLLPTLAINSMGWTPKTMGDWIANNLGPTIAASESSDTLILIIDDQRITLPWYASGIFKNSVAKNYTAGIAVHWYWDGIVSPQTLDMTNGFFPDKFMIQTEACVGSGLWEFPKVRLGDWERGEEYIRDILEILNHWMTGWIDWNLVLDKEGGPSWIHNYVDSPIIVNPETDEFFKQPTYYALAHFSKFVTRGSTRIGATTTREIKTVAFLTPDDEIVVVLYSCDHRTRTIVVKDPQRGNIWTQILPHSIKTIIYRR